ncbi:MAG: sigma-70 family RNA polymerase sigma factor [Spirochaetes bacterium]|nr:sigma-70 family RNA polymerase sigma factor [Spirochaetota bacterium]
MPESGISPGRKDPEGLVRDYGPMVSALARRMLRDPQRARDAAQETWLQVLKGLPRFRGESAVSTWIYAIARRVILRQAARDRIYRFRELSDYFHGEERLAAEAGDREQGVWVREQCDRCLTGMLHCLSPEERLTYILREMVELPYPSVARIMGKEETAIRKTVSRCRARLARFLRRECALANPASPCRCRMANRLEETDLPRAWTRLGGLVRRGRIWAMAEAILPRRNEWEKFLP